MKDALGDRMKDYESNETSRRFIKNLPIYARIDGRGFSRFTKGMSRPFDINMTNSMIETTKTLVDRTSASLGYVQSDEISLCWMDDQIPWFDGKIMKMSSVLASIAASAFIKALKTNFNNFEDLLNKLPHFDCRVINLPNKTEVTNCFLWRNLDCTKNAISMAASHYYSHKELMNKTGSEKQEMLFAKGQNFNSYPYFFKRGVWARRETITREFTQEELTNIPKEHRPPPGTKITRSFIKTFDLPQLNKVSNREAVLFENADPILFKDR